MAPQVGLEPTTLRLTAECSAIELLRNNGMRRRSTLPGRYQPSTIDVLRLNCCVRYGNRWDPQAIATAKGERIGLEACASGVGAIGFRACALFLRLPQVSASCASTRSACLPHADNRTVSPRSLRLRSCLGLSLKSSFRPISIIKLHTLPHFHR